MDHKNVPLSDQFEQLWEETRSATEEKEQIDSSWKKDQERIFAFEEKEERNNRGLLVKLFGVAAVAASIIAILFFVYPLIKENASSTISTDAQQSWVTIENATPSMKNITLPDGSQVLVSPNTTLERAENFNANRDVRITGTAYFKVTKNSSKPFKIMSGDWSSTVLGTSFVLSYAEKDKQFHIDLIEGKLQVENKMNGSDVTIQGGQSLDFDGFEMKEMGEVYDSAKFPQEKDFTNQPLLQILGYLQTTREISVQCEGKVENENLTLRVSKQDRTEDIIQVLQTLSQNQFTLKGNQLIVSKN